MKNYHMVYIAAAVIAMVCLGATGCQSISQRTTTEYTQESAARSQVTVCQRDETINLQEIFISAKTYEEGAKEWLFADGARLSTMLSEMAGQLPVARWGDDFAVQIPEDLSLYYIDLFDCDYGKLERLYNLDKGEDGEKPKDSSGMGFMEYVAKLPEGTYYVAIAVNREGRYVEAEGEYETFGNEYAFRLDKK